MKPPPDRTRSQVANLPGLRAAIVSDRSGALLEASGAVEGESAAAIYAVTADAFARVGQSLGLGIFLRATVSGGDCAGILVRDDDAVLVGLQVAPPRLLAAVESQLDAALRG